MGLEYIEKLKVLEQDKKMEIDLRKRLLCFTLASNTVLYEAIHILRIHGGVTEMHALAYTCEWGEGLLIIYVRKLIGVQVS